MSISETIHGVGNSATSKILSDTSLIHISGVFRGVVTLQIAPGGTTNWVSILGFSRPQALPILTPDLTADYRFICDLKEGSVLVYLGA